MYVYVQYYTIRTLNTIRTKSTVGVLSADDIKKERQRFGRARRDYDRD